MVALVEQMALLEDVDFVALRDQWRRVFRGPAPDLPADLMRRAIAWRLQERVSGGLSLGTIRTIASLQARVVKAGGAVVPVSPVLKPGTKLVREWHGRTCIVLVCDDGFAFENRRYRSLTQIAREITGVAWSGPRFFGLVTRGRKDGDAER